MLQKMSQNEMYGDFISLLTPVSKAFGMRTKCAKVRSFCAVLGGKLRTCFPPFY
jgi:hypothetical protein